MPSQKRTGSLSAPSSEIHANGRRSRDRGRRGDLVSIWRPDGAQVASVGVATDKARTAAIYRRPSKDFEDRELAVFGADALAAVPGSANGAEFFASEAVRAKFATGGLLLDAGAYKLDAGRRQAPGEVEYHAHTVDVMHIVEGTATVVTGGEMVGVRSRGDGELRADAVTGGHPHELSSGDVLAVPAGVPHQFSGVSDPFLYFVVKVEV
ncbi:MAG: heme-binding protein [Solirubrobacteraceae bacterium]